MILGGIYLSVRMSLVPFNIGSRAGRIRHVCGIFGLRPLLFHTNIPPGFFIGRKRSSDLHGHLYRTDLTLADGHGKYRRG